MQGHYMGELWKMAEGWGKRPAAVAQSMQGAGEKLESGVGGGGRARLAKGGERRAAGWPILPQ